METVVIVLLVLSQLGGGLGILAVAALTRLPNKPHLLVDLFCGMP